MTTADIYGLTGGFIMLALPLGMLIGAMGVFGGGHRAQRVVEEWATQQGYLLIDCQRRVVVRGPFFWTAWRRFVVFRVAVAASNGHHDWAWIRYGGSLTGLETESLELRWDQSASRVPGFPVVLAKKAAMTETDPQLSISAATPSDVPVILELIRGLAEYEKLSQDVVATEALLHDHLFGAHPKAEVRIACMGGQAVGFALFFHNFSTFLGRPGIYLEDIFVRPEFRGRGIGRGILKEVARIAAERNCGRLEWSVLNWNEPAIKFYQSLGAKPMSEWTVYRMTQDTLEKLAEKQSIKPQINADERR